MDLLDSDSKIMEQAAQVKKPQTRRKAGLAGLNRFKGLTESYRKTSERGPDKEVALIETDNNSDTKSEGNEVTSAAELDLVNGDDISSADNSDKSNQNIESAVSQKRIKQEYEQATPDNNPDNNKVTPDNNSDNNKVTLDNSPDNNKVTPDNSSDNSSGNNSVPDNSAGDSPNLPPIYDYRTLMGNEKNLLGIIFHECLREGALVTNKIPMSALASKLNTSVGTAKMTTHRLKKKGLIESVEAQRTKNGWTRYGILKELYQMLQSDASFFNSESSRITKQVTKEITKAPSSSSGSFQNNTTSTKELPLNWQIVQIPQNLKEIGISIGHINQIINDGFLTPDEVQDSLEAFSYDLEQGSVNARFGPLRLLLGVLRKQKVPYVSQALIEKERLQLAEYMRKKQEAESVKKQQAELGLVQKFEEWWEGLSSQQRNEVAPPNNIYKEGSNMQRKVARGIFLENPDIIEELNTI